MPQPGPLMTAQVIHGDCMDVLAGMAANTVDAIVCDPPYEIGFMGKGWDGSGIAYRVELWAECLRVLKPGGHLLAFGATRTYHRMTSAIDDAGFDIRDSLHWVYGSGFPKSLDVSKAIDKAAGAEREVVGAGRYEARRPNGVGTSVAHGDYGTEPGHPVTAPATDAARQWSGWGTALKPSHEPIVVARKPLTGTVAANVLAYGTGALNIDGCRVGSDGGTAGATAGPSNGIFGDGLNGQAGKPVPGMGRWPANLVFTHAADCAEACADGCPVAELDGQSGVSKSPAKVTRGAGGQHGKYSPIGRQEDVPCHNDTGGASRFFTVTEWDPIADVAPFRYVAKPSKRERNAGLDGLPERKATKLDGGTFQSASTEATSRVAANHHPTVKPVALMRWLVRLVTPPGGTVLDPFAGSGTTLVAATLEGFNSIGIELTDDYLPIINGRIAWAETQAAAPPDTLFDPRTATA
jgi:DNA modification methylase